MVPVPIPVPKHPSPERRPVQGWAMLWLGLAIAAHGVILGLPLPEVKLPPEEPEVILKEEAPTLDVTLLPEGFIETPPPEESPVSEKILAETSAPRSLTERAVPSADTSPPPVPQGDATEPESPPEALPEPNELPPEPGLNSPSDPPPPPSLDSRLRDPQFYVPNQKTLSDSQATGVFNDWYGRMVAAGLFPQKANPPLAVVYPLTTCLSSPPDIGSLGVVVGRGAVQTVELLKSTGYDVLDEKAALDVFAYPFPNTDQPTAYSLEIRVTYNSDTCQ